VTALDEEIRRVRAACRRYRARLDEMSEQAYRDRDCCPSCRFGHTYNGLADKLERAAAWLVILLRKRGSDRDLADVKRIEVCGFDDLA